MYNVLNMNENKKMEWSVRERERERNSCDISISSKHFNPLLNFSKKLWKKMNLVATYAT